MIYSQIIQIETILRLFAVDICNSHSIWIFILSVHIHMSK